MNECFKWCHFRFLNPQDKNPERIKIKIKKLLKLNIIEVLIFL